MASDQVQGVHTRPIEVQGHRGARGTHPENTMVAFRAALGAGADVLELDLGWTRDEVLVVYHDEALNPSITRRDGEWIESGKPLRELDWATLQGLDVGRLRPGSDYAARFPDQQPSDGETIPRFDEVLALATRLNIELKTSPSWSDEDVQGFTDATIAAVRQAGVAERVNLQSFDFRSLLRIREVAPELARACLTSEQTLAPDVAAAWTAGLSLGIAEPLSGPELSHRAGCTIWSPSHTTLTARAIEDAHARGLRVVPWTVNEIADLERVMRLGADGVISDYPVRALEVVRASAGR